LFAGPADGDADAHADPVAHTDTDLDAGRSDSDVYEHANGDEYTDNDPYADGHADANTRCGAVDQHRRVPHVRVDVCGWSAVLGSE
jgi:hypothetical protein